MHPKICKCLQNQSEQEQPNSRLQNHKQYPFSIFPVGSEVEVSSDEEGFRDAWYLATVIPPPPPSSSPLSLSSKQQHSQLFVEYKNLFADENGCALLKEFVDVAFVRPKPPVDEQDGVLFVVNDVVDAFFQDGWWTGVVTKVIEKEKDCSYKVFFSNPPEELEFGSSNLRVHRNWIDGKWVRPDKEKMKEVSFCPGTTVEVNIDPDNLLDVWYPAKFIKEVENSFLVEYQSSLKAGYQKVVVDSSHIRPSPPLLSKKDFSLLEKVDAFYDFRWLSGVVTKIIAEERYIVYFMRTKKEKELSRVDMRVHLEWTNGKWVHSSRNTSVTPIPKNQLEYSVNGSCKEKPYVPVGADAKEERKNSVNLKTSQYLLQIPGSEKADNGNTMPLNKRTQQGSANVDVIHLRKRANESTSPDAPSSPESGRLRWKQTDKLLNGTSAVLDCTTPAKPGLKPFEDINQSSASIKNVSNGKDSAEQKKGRPLKKRSTELSVLDKTPNGNGLLTPHEPIVTGLTHDCEIIESLSKISSLPLKGEGAKKEEKYRNTKGTPESEDNEPQRDREVTNLKRKRGRPPKALLRLGNPIAKETGSVDSNPSSGSSSRRRWRVLSDHPRGLRARNARTRRQDKRGLESANELFTLEFSEPVALRKGRRQCSTKQFQRFPQVRKRTDEVTKKGVATGVGTAAGTSTNLFDDDIRLLASFEGSHGPTTSDRSSVAGIVAQCDMVGENCKRGEVQNVGQPKDIAQENQDETVVAKCVLQDEEASEKQDQAATNSTLYNSELPFVKNSLIWKMIESMDVLQHIPQRPHFRPLYKYKEECREGLAIGNMVTFTGLVDKISTLQFSDPKNLMDGYLDALTDLEDFGFNVLPVKQRLNTLISVKERCEHAQTTVVDIETQITDHEHEKTKIEGDIAEIDKKIAELNEKRAMAMSKKELKDAEVRLLQSSEDAVKVSIEKAKEEFEKVATGHW